MNKKETNILIDIGNSNTTVTYHDGTRILKTESYLTDTFSTIIRETDFDEYKATAICSVVPKLSALIPEKPGIYHITHENIPLITLDLLNPEQVGADRIVTCLAAYQQYKTDCLVIDSGTALTMEFIDKNGTYQGGSIFPGMRLCSAALNDYTARIPQIWVEPFNPLYGKNTIQAVQAGIYHGFIHMINGTIAHYRKLYPDINVIGTGNGLTILKDELDTNNFDSELVVKGLIDCLNEFEKNH